MKNPIIYEGRLAERLPTNSSRPNSERREKIELIFIFTLLCGASKGFMKACENKNLTQFFHFVRDWAVKG